MKDKFLKILNDNAYPLEKYGAKFIPDYQFERVARELERLYTGDNTQKEANPKKFPSHRLIDNTDWAGLDPVKFKDVKPSRKYIIFGDTEDTNITP